MRKGAKWLIATFIAIVAFIIFAAIMTNVESSNMREEMDRERERNACEEWEKAFDEDWGCY